jgi:ABC-2 type transport system ATP-binding protein
VVSQAKDSDKISQDPGDAVLCRDLTKIYRKWAAPSKAICALKEVGLSVHKGQIVGLIGPNGAGKSTLLNLIAGLILPTSGEVAVCGHPARSVAARRHLGYMPEHPAFLGNYSARETLRYHCALLGLSRTEMSLETDRAIGQLQMQDFADRPAGDFSQGMKQRLALGCAMLGDPGLLLLDEPSNGLDPVGIIQLRDLLIRLRDGGTAIVISSHRLGELEKMTSDYIFMDHGRIVTFGDQGSAGQGGRLCIGLESGGRRVAGILPAAWQVVEASDTDVVIALGGPAEIADVVACLAKADLRITRVLMQKEDVEETFLRLAKGYHENV